MEIQGKLINTRLIEWVSTIDIIDSVRTSFGFDIHFTSGKTMLFNYKTPEEAKSDWNCIWNHLDRNS